MNLNKKFIFSFLGVALLVLIAGAVAVVQVNKVGNHAINIGQYKLPLIRAALKLRNQLAESRITVEEAAQFKDINKTNSLENQFLLLLRKAGFLAKAIKDGKQTADETIHKSDNITVQNKIKAAIQELLSYQKSGAEYFGQQRQTIEKENLAMKALDRINTGLNQISETESEVEVEVEEGGEEDGLNLNAIVVQLDFIREIMKEYVHTSLPERIHKLKQDFQMGQQDLIMDLEQLLKDGRNYSARDMEKAADLKRRGEEFIHHCQVVVTAKAGIMESEAAETEAMEKFEKNYRRIIELLKETEAAINEEVAESVNEADKSKTASAVIMAILTAVCLAAAVILGGLLSRSVVNPIQRVMEVADHIAQEDLTDEMIAVPGRDEVSRLAESLNHMKANLSDIVIQIKEAADNVTGETSNISHGNQELSLHLQDQSSSLEETAATMEEMSANIKTNADNTQKANKIAKATVRAAQKGEEVIQRTIQSMEEVTSSSRKIEEIIGVVNDIAFQTNLLALNAAVEAARAGEQGRGFAVVAGEVRNLAGRSAEAVKQIKGLISESVKKAKTGSQLVEESSSTLNEIIGQINQVAAMIDQITASSQEQSTGMDQVNLAINQMDRAVQQNASLVEKATVTSKNLSTQANELNRLMSKFRIKVSI